MKYREKLGYMALGGLLMLVGMLAANLTPLTAQRDTFGEITCTGLKVVNSHGRAKVWLNSNSIGGNIYIYGEAGRTSSLVWRWQQVHTVGSSVFMPSATAVQVWVSMNMGDGCTYLKVVRGLRVRL